MPVDLRISRTPSAGDVPLNTELASTARGEADDAGAKDLSGFARMFDISPEAATREE